MVGLTFGDVMNTAYFADGLFNEDVCWDAIRNRDDAASEQFLYGVITTGVFCRPNCRSRKPKRENLRFFTNAADAHKAGFRACKRCRPDEPIAVPAHAEIVRKVCRRIEEVEDMPALHRLAAEIGISSAHLNRVFRKVTGVTPKAYMAGLKAGRIRKALRGEASVTQALYHAGYGSSSRFYEESGDILGMAPLDYKAGGQGASIEFACGRCWLGLTLVAATQRGICAILLGESEDALEAELRGIFHKAHIIKAGMAFAAQLAQVLAAIEQPELARYLPLDISGTAFQQRIWAALRNIPVGMTASYKDVAERVGEPKAVRAIAHACAANKLAIAIPCHRVVRSDGSISGYHWGTERKRKLLAREANAYEDKALPVSRSFDQKRSD